MDREKEENSLLEDDHDAGDGVGGDIIPEDLLDFDLDGHPILQEVTIVADKVLLQLDLFKRFLIHEGIGFARIIEELKVFLLQSHTFDCLVGAETFIGL